MAQADYTRRGEPSQIHPVTLAIVAAPPFLGVAIGLLWGIPLAFAMIVCAGILLATAARPGWAVLALFAILPFDVYLGSFFLSELVVVSLMAGLAIHQYRLGRAWTWDSLLTLLFLYWLCTSATMLVAVDRSSVVKAALRLALICGAAVMSEQIEWNVSLIRRLLLTLAVTGSAFSAYGIWESLARRQDGFLDGLLHLIPTESALGDEQIVRVHATFRYVLEYGVHTSMHFCLLITVFALGAASQLSHRMRWGLAGAAVLEFVAIVLSFARSSWLGVGAAVVFLLIGMLRKQRRIAFRMLAVVAFLGLAAIPFLTRKAESIQDLTGDIVRLSLWLHGTEVIRAHPLLGVGPNNLQYYMPNLSLQGKALPVGTLENLYLTVAGETGLISLLFVLTIFWAALRRSFKAMPLAPTSLSHGFIAAAGVAIVVAMTAGLTDPVLTSTPNAILLSLLLGAQRGACRMLESGTVTEAPFKPSLEPA